MITRPTPFGQPPHNQSQKSALPGKVRTEVTVEQAAEEYLRYIEHDRARKPSTVQGYRWGIKAWIAPPLGRLYVEDVTSAHVEAWIAALERKPSTRRKALVLLHGIFKRAARVYGLPINPVSDVEMPPQTRSGDIEVFSPEEVWH
jgi:site-specific recombinase XerD